MTVRKVTNVGAVCSTTPFALNSAIVQRGAMAALRAKLTIVTFDPSLFGPDGLFSVNTDCSDQQVYYSGRNRAGDPANRDLSVLISKGAANRLKRAQKVEAALCDAVPKACPVLSILSAITE